MLNNWKIYAVLLILFITIISIQKIKLVKLEKDIKTYQANETRAKLVSDQTLAKYKISQLQLKKLENNSVEKEQEAKALMGNIMLRKIPRGCNGAINTAIEDAQRIKFHWDNNIP